MSGGKTKPEPSLQDHATLTENALSEAEEILDKIEEILDGERPSVKQGGDDKSNEPGLLFTATRIQQAADRIRAGAYRLATRIGAET